MTMTSHDIVPPTKDSTTGIVVHLTCDMCATADDMWMPTTFGQQITEHAKRVLARGRNWRFHTTKSRQPRTVVICPAHPQVDPDALPGT